MNIGALSDFSFNLFMEMASSVQKSPAQREPEKSSKVEKLRKEFEKILTTWEKVKVERKF